MAGGIHADTGSLETILQENPRKEQILGWIRNKVNITDFIVPYRGKFKGSMYKSDFPPRKCFSNHRSCKKFSDFVSKEILKRVKTGALRVWGRVGFVDPPYLVLPLTVEPTKPRLCLDARFLNLWMRDQLFNLDGLVDVPRYVYKGSYMSKCDDKSGYDHVLLTVSSQTYAGFQWESCYLVCATLPFGWKISPYIYHTIGSAATTFFRSIGIPCSLYIDDRLTGEIMTGTGSWSVPPEARDKEYRYKAAMVALWCVLMVLAKLEYTIGISKSVLCPTTSLEYLGLIVDSVSQCFRVPSRKIEAWAFLRESILAHKESVHVKSLQRFQGKCISFSLAVPAAKLFIREISRGIGRVSSSGFVCLTQDLREELEYWRFLDTWEESVPWRSEYHMRMSVSSDASGFGWGGVIHLPLGDQVVRDFCRDNEKELDIATKEVLALANVVESLPPWVKNCRLDASVDSQVLIGVWEGEGSRKSRQLCSVTKHLFKLVSQRNLQLELSYVRSGENEADAPSRRLSRLDAMLSNRAWNLVQDAFGGTVGHTIDLMALDSNVVCGKDSLPLPHFTPFPSRGSQGVNLFSQDLGLAENMCNPYVFPPFGLIGPVLRYLSGFRLSFSIIVPELHPRPYWWPELVARSECRILLGERGNRDTILIPKKEGYCPAECEYKIWAFRVVR